MTIQECKISWCVCVGAVYVNLLWGQLTMWHNKMGSQQYFHYKIIFIFPVTVSLRWDHVSCYVERGKVYGQASIIHSFMIFQDNNKTKAP